MDTEWKKLGPGEIGDGPEIYPLEEDAAILLAGKPDWVKDPATGNPVACVAKFKAESPVLCPKCKTDLGLAILIVAEVDDNLDKQWVSVQCPTVCNQFIWKQVSK